MSNRVITNQQFSDGTTIDGNRIEDAMQDIERFIDKVPSAFVKRRFVQNQLVSGWSPFPSTGGGGRTTIHPWMEDENTVSGSKNQYRLKGYYRVGGAGGKHYIWNQAFQPEGPIIIEAFDLIMAQDFGTGTGSGHPHVYAMGATTYPNYVPPDVTDFELHITIDSPYIPEDRSQNDMELHRHSFSGQAHLFRPTIATPAPANDMLPAVNGGGLSGYAVSLQNLNIPIAPFSRVRYAVVIPKYPGGSTGETNWTTRPWASSVWSQTLTILEPNRNG
jgi:hypothetical protein